MKKVLFIALTSIVLLSLFSSCASILNSRRQNVSFITNNKETKLFVDGEEQGKGTLIETKITRDMKPKQIKVSRFGYKDKYKVICQYKRPILYYVSWIPFGAFSFCVIPLYDSGPKSYDYDKEIQLANEVKSIERKENQKYIFTNRVKLDLGENDLSIESYYYNRYTKNRSATRETSNDEVITFDNTIFAEAINDILYDSKYIDTTISIFKDKTNTLYVNATIEKIKFREVINWKTAHLPMKYLVAESSIDWEISDVYDQVKYTKTIKCSSGEFSRDNYDEVNDYTYTAIEDCIHESFLKFIDNKEVQNIIKLEEESDYNFEEIVIHKNKPRIFELSDAQESTVTIKHKNGHGSGCIISREGYIVTNFHVIAGEEELEIILHDGTAFDAIVVRSNEFKDLALLKVNNTFDKHYIIPNKNIHKIGMDVYAIGTPRSIELGQSLTRGIISGFRKNKNKEWIQSDVSVNSGNSGGALVNKQGELIGIVNSKMMGYGVEGISFIIPSKEICNALGINYK